MSLEYYSQQLRTRQEEVVEVVEEHLHTTGIATEQDTNAVRHEEVTTADTVQTVEAVIIHMTSAITIEPRHTHLHTTVEHQAALAMGIIVHMRVTITREIIIPQEVIHHNMMTEDMVVEGQSLIQTLRGNGTANGRTR